MLVFMLLCPDARATTWAPVYPYVQKTEGGRITCRSVPYGVHDGPAGLGETFVYNKGKLLYSIDRYFLTPFFTYGDGRYLVTFDFQVASPNRVTRFIDEDGTVVREEWNEPEEKAIHIYDQGTLLKTVMFSELKVDHSKDWANTAGRWFKWNYMAPEQDATTLDKKMAKHPAFIEGERLCLIAADGQLIEIHIPTGEIVGRSVASEVLGERTAWNPSGVKRKYKRTKYLDTFFLPPLKDGRFLEEAAADLLGMVASDVLNRDADPKIYVHTLLINGQGRCEVVHIMVTPKEGKDTTTAALEERGEAWLREQTFDTRSMPRRFPKFKYSGFIRLDSP